MLWTRWLYWCLAVGSGKQFGAVFVSAVSLEAPAAPVHEVRGRRWLYSTHHKAGTDLFRKLAQIHAEALQVPSCICFGQFGDQPPGCKSAPPRDTRLWFDGLVTQDFYDKRRVGFGTDSGDDHDFRAIHGVRDPEALVVSGYLYHLRTADYPAELAGQRHLPMADGLALQARWALNYSLPRMLAVYDRANPAPGTPWTDQRDLINVRLEEVTSNYNATIRRIFTHMVGDMVEDHTLEAMIQAAYPLDIKTHPSTAAAQHVAPASQTTKGFTAMRHLPADIQRELQFYRQRLGY